MFGKKFKHGPWRHQHLLASSAVKHVRHLCVCCSAFSFSAQTHLCRCVWSSLHLEVTRSLLSGLWFPLYRLKTEAFKGSHTHIQPDVRLQKRLQDVSSSRRISQSEVRSSFIISTKCFKNITDCFECWLLALDTSLTVF